MHKLKFTVIVNSNGLQADSVSALLCVSGILPGRHHQQQLHQQCGQPSRRRSLDQCCPNADCVWQYLHLQQCHHRVSRHLCPGRGQLYICQSSFWEQRGGEGGGNVSGKLQLYRYHKLYLLQQLSHHFWRCSVQVVDHGGVDQQLLQQQLCWQVWRSCVRCQRNR